MPISAYDCEHPVTPSQFCVHLQGRQISKYFLKIEIEMISLSLQDCLCQPPFPPGCDCDPDIPNADAFCPGDLRCVGCNCQVQFVLFIHSKLIKDQTMYIID